MTAWWAAAVAALMVAVVSGVGDWGRNNRRDFDRIGWIDWPALQLLAVIVGLMCAAVALRG